MTDYARDFVKAYMELMPADPRINREAHKMLATTIGAALGLILTKFKYDLEHDKQETES